MVKEISLAEAKKRLKTRSKNELIDAVLFYMQKENEVKKPSLFKRLFGKKESL